ncbi:MAG: hypothetical protein U0521_20155 [Anaerolineae bacterium]
MPPTAAGRQRRADRRGRAGRVRRQYHAGGRLVDRANAGAWALLVARGLPSVLYVRARLRLERSQPHGKLLPLVAHAAALAVVIVLAVNNLIPLWSIAVPVLLLARAVYGLSPYRRGHAARQIGVQEVVFGVVAISVIALSYADFEAAFTRRANR